MSASKRSCPSKDKHSNKSLHELFRDSWDLLHEEDKWKALLAQSRTEKNSSLLFALTSRAACAAEILLDSSGYPEKLVRLLYCLGDEVPMQEG